jgi:hypothetical protein
MKMDGKEFSVSETVATLKGIPTKEELMEMLKNQVVEVTFTKLNGDERVMPCTLQELYLPPRKEGTAEKKSNDKVVSVWAMEANGFRSFHYDRVKAAKVINWHIGDENC